MAEKVGPLAVIAAMSTTGAAADATAGDADATAGDADATTGGVDGVATIGAADGVATLPPHATTMTAIEAIATVNFLEFNNSSSPLSLISSVWRMIASGFGPGFLKPAAWSILQGDGFASPRNGRPWHHLLAGSAWIQNIRCARRLATIGERHPPSPWAANSSTRDANSAPIQIQLSRQRDATGDR